MKCSAPLNMFVNVLWDEQQDSYTGLAVVELRVRCRGCGEEADLARCYPSVDEFQYDRWRGHDGPVGGMARYLNIKKTRADVAEYLKWCYADLSQHIRPILSDHLGEIWDDQEFVIRMGGAESMGLVEKYV